MHCEKAEEKHVKPVEHPVHVLLRAGPRFPSSMPASSRTDTEDWHSRTGRHLRPETPFRALLTDVWAHVTPEGPNVKQVCT